MMRTQWTDFSSCHRKKRTWSSGNCAVAVSPCEHESNHHLVRSEDGTPKMMMDWMFFTSDDRVGFTMPVLIVYDLVSAAVTAIQEARRSTTVQAVAATLETWRHTGIVLHADGEPSTSAIVSPMPGVHKSRPRHARCQQVAARSKRWRQGWLDMLLG